MRISLLIIVMLCFGCVENEKSVYLQAQEIHLAQPRVEVLSTIIDSSVIVTADLRIENAEIFYTNDGTEPKQESLKYSKPLKIKKEGTYKFKAFHPDWKPSDITTLRLYDKGYKPSIIDWETTANKTYPGLGELTVLNNKKGTLNFRDTQWLGFDSIAKASVSFMEERFIKSLAIGYLIDTKSWIFPPSAATIYLNENDSITVAIPELKEGTLKMLNDVRIPINKKIKTITIAVKNTKKLPEWHPGKGLKAWLFIDEWIFN